MKATQDLKTKLNKEIETQMRTQYEMEMELKDPIAQLEDPKGSLANTMNQAKNRISGLEDKGEYLDQIINEHETT